MTFGGPAANAAATAVALGVRTVLVTALGAGPIADLVRAGLAAAGVEVVDLLDGVPGSPAVSTVLVTRATGERAVVSVNAVGAGDLQRPRHAASTCSTGATALLVDGHHLEAAEVLAAARARRPGAARRRQLEARAGPAARARRPRGALGRLRGCPTSPRTCSIASPTSDRGSWRSRPARARSGSARSTPTVERSSTVLQPPVVPAAEVVDTLGAGDVLHGATRPRSRRGHDVLTALADGVARATESVRHPGALGWVPVRRPTRRLDSIGRSAGRPCVPRLHT